MNRMNVKVLKRLKHTHTNIKFTIYLPLRPGPENTAPNISTLHKALAMVRQVMKEANLPSTEQEAIASNVVKLENELGHQMPGKGVVILIFNSSEVEMYALPFYVEPAIYYGLQTMHLEPIKQYYRKTPSYWVLALNQNGCHLFKGDHLGLKAVHDSTIQASMLSILGLDEAKNPEVQSHKVTGGGRQLSEGFHGYGGFKDKHKKYMQNYLRIMDKQLHHYIGNKSDPILLIGAQNVQSLYKKVSHHKHISTSRLSFSRNRVPIDSILELMNSLSSDGSLKQAT